MSNERTYTPGPWILTAGRAFETQSGEFYITYGEDKYKNPLWKGGGAELDRNATLIASAPELLEALEIAKVTITRLGQQRHGFNSYQGTLDVINKALEKAKGLPTPYLDNRDYDYPDAENMR